MCTTVGRTLVDEGSARRRDFYLIHHNTHYRQTSMPPLGFEPTISAGKRSQTYVRTSTPHSHWDCNILDLNYLKSWYRLLNISHQTRSGLVRVHTRYVTCTSRFVEQNCCRNYCQQKAKFPGHITVSSQQRRRWQLHEQQVTQYRMTNSLCVEISWCAMVVFHCERVRT